MAPRSLVSSDRIGDFDKKKTPGFCWRKSAKFSQAFVRRWGTVQLGCLDSGMTKSWGRRKVVWFPYLKGGRCVIDRGNEMWIVLLMEWMFFLKNSQVVAFRISFDCFLVGFCFVSEKTSCWQPMVSPLDLFRFASVSGSYWFHFGIGNSQSPRSESGRVMCPTKHGWMARDAAVVWCFLEIPSIAILQNDTWHVSPVHPCGSGDLMSLTSGQCQAEWNFG